MDREAAIEVIQYFDAYNDHFTELRAFIGKKLEKVVGDDLDWLLDSLSEEERLVMRGNSLEHGRIRLFSSLDLADVKSGELIMNTPKELQGRMRLVVSAMQESIDYIKQTNNTVLDIIEKKLAVQSNALKNGKISSGVDTYSATGAKIRRSMGTMDNDIIGSV